MTVKIEMDMPKRCFDCKFRYKRKVPEFFGGYREVDTCFITGTNVYGHGKTRAQDCPLKEIDESKIIKIVPPPNCSACPMVSIHDGIEYCMHNPDINSKTLGMHLTEYGKLPDGCPAKECK